MPESVKSAIKRWAKEGMYWPFVHDPTSSQPSVTLMFFYIGFAMAMTAVGASSVLMLIKGDYLTATFMPVVMVLMGFIFYRLRHLDKVKVDLNDQEFELSSSENTTTKE